MNAYSTSKAYFHHTLMREKVATLTASDRKDGPIGYIPIDGDSKKYIARRLTPRECARLQGFPADWCEGLENENPSDEELAFFRNVWDEWNDIQGKKHKSEQQLRKWLRNPPANSTQYKAWGNSLTIPIPQYIFERIARYENGELDA